MPGLAPKPGAPASAGFWPRWGGLVCGVILVAGTFLAYGPVRGHDFLNFDDPSYVTRNPHVQGGLSWAAVKWALTATEATNWHPVTWLSHMLDCQFYGHQAGGHHLTSLLLHAANAWLLFLLLARLTRRRASSFVVAALFAWHPLHVESVAWIAERKDVLSTCFGLLTLLAYQAYVLRLEGSSVRSEEAKPNAPTSRLPPPAAFWYALTLLCFALGLMSKPMLVTLPFVLWLLDYWPLRRLEFRSKNAEGRSQNRPTPSAGPSNFILHPSSFIILFEKIPFLALSAASCATTLWAQTAGGAVISVQALPLGRRLANAVLAYYGYLGKLAWPEHLAAFYPYPSPPQLWLVGLAAGALVGLTVAALRARQAPYAAMGWLWFLGTLVPVIGLVQVGSQAMADRYSYFPSIGLFILGAFGWQALTQRFRVAQALSTGLTCGLLGGCLFLTRHQVAFWLNSETLFQHAIEVTDGNYVAYNNLGVDLESKGRLAEAAQCYQKALLFFPAYSDALSNLGNCYRELKQPREATEALHAALQLKPEDPKAHYLLANLLLAQGEADAAAEHYATALAVNPAFAEAHYQLGLILLGRNEVEAATRRFHEALRLKPDWVEALNNLAWLLATRPEAPFRNGPEALQLAAHAVTLTRTNDATPLDTLGVALAEVGRFAQAIQTTQVALRLTGPSDTNHIAHDLRNHLESYRQGEPVREPAAAPGPATK